MEDIKQDLKLIILRHTGRSNPITARELAERYGHEDDRVIRKLIADLIDEGFPVCSVTDDPAGYFFPANVDEAREYTVSLRRRALRIFLRRRHIIRSTARWYEEARQGVLAL